MKKIYEISVYNKDVREKIQTGTAHESLKSSWANVHLIEIRADNEQEALNRCRRKHPEKLGFVMGTALQVV